MQTIVFLFKKYRAKPFVDSRSMKETFLQRFLARDVRLTLALILAFSICLVMKMLTALNNFKLNHNVMQNIIALQSIESK